MINCIESIESVLQELDESIEFLYTMKKSLKKSLFVYYTIFNKDLERNKKA